MVRQQQVMIFGGSRTIANHEVRINRADAGDANVVLSLPDQPGAVALPPDEARRFADAVLRAVHVIESDDYGVER
jgi:hypothetical protein